MTTSKSAVPLEYKSNTVDEIKIRTALSWEACLEFLRNSSCFIFHKRSRFRRSMINLVVGRIERPSFRTVDDLLDYYTQRINAKTETLFRENKGSTAEV